MLACKISLQLKAGCVNEFRQKIASEVIPLLRKQKGFRDELTLLYPNGKEVHAFSLWETAESAGAYHHGVYTLVKDILASLLEGTPRVQTYEVLNSTFHNIAALAVSA
jgi:hypothetical protein